CASAHGAAGRRFRCCRAPLPPTRPGARRSGSASYPYSDNAPLEQSALLAEAVEILDPTHPLFGLTLPLLEVSVHASLGRVCVVQLRPNRTRLIPLAATNLGGIFPPASPCRLSVPSASALLRVVASFPPSCQEDAHAQARAQARS